MTYRVIQWATGTTGKRAVEGILAHPELELVGAWVHSEAKDGVDVGEICGSGPIGVKATRDKQALLAMDADCVSFMPARTWGGDKSEMFADILAILRSGKNVANLWWPTLVNPRDVGEEAYQQILDACAEGKSSIYTGGMNPGFGTLGLMMMGFNLSSSVEMVRCTEFCNYAYWADPMAKIFGFGQPSIDQVQILQPGVTTQHYGAPLRLMAEALGVEIEEIVEEHDVIYANERFDIATGPIEIGTISGMTYQVIGMVGGKARVSIGAVARLHDEDFVHEAFPGNGYRAEIKGSPTMRFDVHVESGDDHDHGLGVTVAMTAINAIPQICKAAPGFVRMIDLPLTSRRFDVASAA